LAESRGGRRQRADSVCVRREGTNGRNTAARECAGHETRTREKLGKRAGFPWFAPRRTRAGIGFPRSGTRGTAQSIAILARNQTKPNPRIAIRRDDRDSWIPDFGTAFPWTRDVTNRIFSFQWARKENGFHVSQTQLNWQTALGRRVVRRWKRRAKCVFGNSRTRCRTKKYFFNKNDEAAPNASIVRSRVSHERRRTRGLRGRAT
jgi:hypothetical protein